MSGSSINALMGQLCLRNKSDFVPRPGYADTANHDLYDRVIPVITNHFRVTIPDNCFVWMYDVDILETTPSRSAATGAVASSAGSSRAKKRPAGPNVSKAKAQLALETLAADDRALPAGRRLFFNSRTGNPISPIFVGAKILYTSTPLAKDRCIKNVIAYETEGGVPETERNRLTFLVTISCEKRLDLGRLKWPNDVPNEEKLALIMALNAVLKYGPSINKVSIGQNRLFSIASIDGVRGSDHLGNGVFSVNGHFQSVRVSGDGTGLVVNQSTGGFYPNTTLLGFLKYLMEDPRVIGNELKQQYMCVLREASTVRILGSINFLTVHNGYPKRFTQFLGISKIPLSQERIVNDGTSVSLMEYYKSTYANWLDSSRINLDLYHDFPCLEFNAGKDPVTRKKKVIKIPIPLLWIKPNQHVAGD